MSAVQIKLEHYVVTSVRVEAAAPDKAPFSPQIKAVTNCGVSSSKANPAMWKSDVTVTFGADGAGVASYSGAVVLSGIFTATGDGDREEVQKVVVSVALSVLYTAARDIVATLSARGPWPAIFLGLMQLGTPSQSAPVASQPDGAVPGAEP